MESKENGVIRLEVTAFGCGTPELGLVEAFTGGFYVHRLHTSSL
ncbi:hypothetical protein [Clostridium frigoris]|nr:hypothetical protein [Clostridium frigoris]